MRDEQNNMYLIPSILQSFVGKGTDIWTNEVRDISNSGRKQEFENGICLYSGLFKTYDNEFVVLETPDGLVAVKRNIITSIEECDEDDSGSGGLDSQEGSPGGRKASSKQEFICEDCQKELEAKKKLGQEAKASVKSNK